MSLNKRVVKEWLGMVDLLDEWQQLPPLVRASVASGWAERLGTHVQTEARVGDNLDMLGLKRRADVARRFGRGSSILMRLCIRLAAQADAEAVERGIDQDVK